MPAIALFVLILLSSQSWSAEMSPKARLNTTICQQPEFQDCLDTTDAEFEECEDECKQHPNDAGGYNDCRNVCRDERTKIRDQCYKDYCRRQTNDRKSKR